MGVSSESQPDNMQFAEVERHGGGRGKGWWNWDDLTREECEERLGRKLEKKERWCERRNGTDTQECLNDAEAWYLNAVDEKCPVSCVDQA